MNRPLTAAFWDYDRTRALVDGRIRIDGCEIAPRISAPEETFRRAADAEFDISELSFSNSVTRLSQGVLPYVLIPVFLSRAFRHAMIFVRDDRGIARPEDLRGKAVGVQEYDMTAAVVVRGFLRDQFGVFPEDLRWKVGESAGGVMPAFAGGRPKSVSIDLLPAGKSLDQRLLDGELDAMLVLRPSPATLAAGSGVRPLFADARAVEQAWFEKSGLFPIMHCVGIRQDLVRQDPDLPMKVYRAFLEAKELAISELQVIQAPKVTLPWPSAAVADAKTLMGDDYWPYGVAKNRKTLEAELGWSWLDGLQAKRLSVDDLFDPTLYAS